MHAQMKHTLANLQDLIPTLADMIISMQQKPVKVGIARVYFICACMDVPTQLEICLHYQLDSKLVTCFLTLYCNPYSFFRFLFISSLFTFYCTIGPHLSALILET